jgi:hypothetical protein
VNSYFAGDKEDTYRCEQSPNGSQGAALFPTELRIGSR